MRSLALPSHHPAPLPPTPLTFPCFAHGREYYYNSANGESTFERPLEFMTPRPGQRPTGAAAPGGDGWETFHDDASGQQYYHNATTGETQWPDA